MELRPEGTAHPVEGIQTAAAAASDRDDLEKKRQTLRTHVRIHIGTDLERQTAAAAAEDIPVRHHPGTSDWAVPQPRTNW